MSYNQNQNLILKRGDLLRLYPGGWDSPLLPKKSWSVQILIEECICSKSLYHDFFVGIIRHGRRWLWISHLIQKCGTEVISSPWSCEPVAPPRSSSELFNIYSLETHSSSQLCVLVRRFNGRGAGRNVREMARKKMEIKACIVNCEEDLNVTEWE